MKWVVVFHEKFEPEFDALGEEVQEEALANITLLERFGPLLGRPRVDTLNGSSYPNMKELRFDAAGGVWRIAFAFDPKRRAILFCCGDKSGGSARSFYRRLVAKADERYGVYLARLKSERE